MQDGDKVSLKEISKQLENWVKILQNDPLWYKTVAPVLIDWEKKLPKHPQKDQIKEIIYNFFQSRLDNDEILLGKDGPSLDQGRKTIDMAVIHHTSRPSGVTWQTLSAIALVRLYIKEYYLSDDQFGVNTKDFSIWSGHFKDNKQTFCAYHWLVRMDGSFERLLEDSYVGWQAGNKDINMRSIAIVLDGDLEEAEPSKKSLEGIVYILKDNYPNISKERVIGHLEANPKTTCPGNLFIPSWKEKLLVKL